MALPIIDVSPLFQRDADVTPVARAIRHACEEAGFFYASSHGLDPSLLEQMRVLSRSFFELPEENKRAISMSLGGRAWRGFFPLEGELTSGEPDKKEGIYFGAELGPEDPRVQAGVPLHGPNLWPKEVPQLRSVVLEYLARATELGHALMRGISLSLDLPADWFSRNYTADPIVLFRIFNYPASKEGWGVGEHTDYGLLTLLLQDEVAGLEVKSRQGWIEAPPIAGTLVCNIGDMLDRMTAGRYRSTPHRVRNRSDRARLSFAFFFDPAWSAELIPIPGFEVVRDDQGERWDGASVHAYAGTYGDYLVNKVSRVFPELAGVLNYKR